jgi:hypothetical protein
MNDQEAEIIKKEYLEDMETWNFDSLHKELLNEEPQKDLDNDLWVQQVWIGSLDNYVDRSLEDYTDRFEIWEEALSETIDKQKVSLYTYYYDNSLIIGRFVSEDEYYNHPVIMTSLHKTFELCCDCGKILFPPSNRRSKDIWDKVSFVCYECSIEIEKAKIGKIDWLVHGKFFEAMKEA